MRSIRSSDALSRRLCGTVEDAIAQAYWVAFLFSQATPGIMFYLMFALGAILELTVSILAEKNGTTSWHRHHIIERYGLLTIIVLGETLLAASIALEQVSESLNSSLIYLAFSALTIVFSMWWLYFSSEEHLETNKLSRALTWGYGHILIFASGAAVGAGFGILVDVVTEHLEVGLTTGNYAVAIPIALYLVGLWFVRDRFALSGIAQYSLLMFAALILIAPLFLSFTRLAALTVLCVFMRSYMVQRKTAF